MNGVSKKPSTIVKSKYFSNNKMDDSFKDFQEPKKTSVGPKMSKSKSKKKVRKIKGQTDIRKVISKPNDLVSYSEYFNKVCIEAGIDVDVEHLQLAVAMSKSMQVPEPNLKETQNVTTSQERRNKIRSTLLEYGFHVPDIKIDKEVKKRFRKRYSKVRSESKLLHTTEDERQQIINIRYCQVLIENTTYKTNEVNEKPLSNSDIYNLSTNLPYYELTNDKYFVKGIVEEANIRIDGLLGDWSKIPGRPKSPVCIERFDLQFSNVTYTQEELDVILSGRFIAMKEIVRNKQNYNKPICEEEDANQKNIETSYDSIKKLNDFTKMEIPRCVSPDIFDDELSLIENNKTINKLNLTKSQELPKINTTLCKMPLSQPSLHCTKRNDDDFMELTECLTSNISQNKENITNLANRTTCNTILSQTETDNTKRKSDDFMDLTECVKSASQKLEVINETQGLKTVWEDCMDQSSDSNDSALPCFYMNSNYKPNDFTNNKVNSNANISLFDDYNYHHSDESANSTKINNIDLTQTSTSSEDIFATQEDIIYEENYNYRTKVNITKEPFREFINDVSCFSENKEQNSNLNSSITDETIHIYSFDLKKSDSAEINSKISKDYENIDIIKDIEGKSIKKDDNDIIGSNSSINYGEIERDQPVNENLSGDKIDLTQEIEEEQINKYDSKICGSNNFSIDYGEVERDQYVNEKLNSNKIDLTQEMKEEQINKYDSNICGSNNFLIDYREIEREKQVNENLSGDKVDLTQEIEEEQINKYDSNINGSNNYSIDYGEIEREQVNENLSGDKIDLTQEMEEAVDKYDSNVIKTNNYSIDYGKVEKEEQISENLSSNKVTVKEHSQNDDMKASNSNLTQSSSQCTVFEISDEELDYSMHKSRNFQNLDEDTDSYVFENNSDNYETDDSLPAVEIEGIRVKMKTPVKSQTFTPTKNKTAMESNKSLEYCGNTPNSLNFAETGNKSQRKTPKKVLQETIPSLESGKKSTPIKNILHESVKNCGNTKQQNVTPIKKVLRESIISVETPTNSGYIIKTTDVTPMLDYEAMTSPERNKELDKYGIKPIKRKRAIQLLQHIYNQTHPIVEDDIEIKRIKMSEDKQQDKTEDKLVEINFNRETNIYDVTSESPVLNEIHCDPKDWVLPKKRRAKIHTCPTPLHIVFHNYISSRIRLKEAILCYKPVDIEIIHKQLADYGYKFDSKELLKFLDKKCVTVKTADNYGKNKKSPKKASKK